LLVVSRNGREGLQLDAPLGKRGEARSGDFTSGRSVSALIPQTARLALCYLFSLSTYYRNKYRSTIDLTLTTRWLTVYSMTTFTDFNEVPHYNITRLYGKCNLCTKRVVFRTPILYEIPQKLKIVICPSYTEFYLHLINVESKGTTSFTTFSDL